MLYIVPRPIPIFCALEGVDVSFTSFLCAREKENNPSFFAPKRSAMPLATERTQKSKNSVKQLIPNSE